MNNLEKTIKERCINQTAMASEVGLTINYFNNLVKGKRLLKDVKTDTVVKIADFLNVKMEYLLEED